MTENVPAIETRGLVNRFDSHYVHDGLNLSVRAGEVLGIVGGSGTGKSVLLNTLLGLRHQNEGEILYFGEALSSLSLKEKKSIKQRFGVLFQQGALFSSLSVRENVMFPMREYTHYSPSLMKELADFKIMLSGLPPEAQEKLPGELSGGMIKRAALARALALDPDILFLDEPTAGLDPIGAAAFDILIKQLQSALGMTVLMVTHDLDSLHAICDRVAVLADKKVVAVAPLSDLEHNSHPWIQEYFSGPRGRAAAYQHKKTGDL